MPYELRKQEDKYCVFNKETGESSGCSDTRSKALAHMRALYANEKAADPEAMIVKAIADFGAETGEEITAEEIEESLKMEAKEYYDSYSWTPATSYAQLEQEKDARERMYKANDLIGQFPMLARNIIANPELEDKAGAVETLASELAARLQEVSNKETQPKQKGLIGRLIDKVTGKEEVSNIDTKEAEDPSSMMVFKDNEGQWIWVARYSNKFRDDDVVPEIIASESHRHFTEAVDKGLAPYPELWLWHVKEWFSGRADLVAYDDVGFALAAGHFNPGCEGVAEWLSKQDDMAVSHGMLTKSIRRDPNDPTVIIEHRTSEISPLPRWAAANKRTDFITSMRKSAHDVEEVEMIPQQKKDALKKMGLTDEMLTSLETMNADDATKAIQEGIESKENEEATEPVVEADAAETAPVQPDEPQGETSEADATPADPAPVEDETKETDVEAPVTRKEIAEAFASVFQPYTERMEALETSIKSIQDALAGLDTAVKEQNTFAGTPVASLAAMFAESATRSKDNQVAVDDPLVHLKPKETKPATGVTGISFIDQFLTPGQ